MGVGASWVCFSASRGRNQAVEDFPMHLAAKEGNLELMKHFLDIGMSVDSRDYDKYTPLHYAAECGQLEIVEYLIENQCDLDVRNWQGRTPVLLATRKRHRDVIELLVRSGADARCCNSDQWTVLHYASYKGWLDIVHTILKNGKFNLNMRTSDGDTPLLMAARSRHTDIIQLLIQSGADINCHDNDKWTLLHYASYEDWFDIVQTVVVDKHAELNVRDTFGNSPLHLACYKRRKEIVRLLLKSGIDTNIKNNMQETALNRLTKLITNAEAISLLVYHDAVMSITDFIEIYSNPLLREHFLSDVDFCTRAVINKFNCESLPELYKLFGNRQKLPHIDKLKVFNGQNVAYEIEKSVEYEIQTKKACNVAEDFPIVLKLMSVKALVKYLTILKLSEIYVPTPVTKFDFDY